MRLEVLPSRKQTVSLRLDADVIGWLKKDGPGYQTRANQMLRRRMLQDLEGLRAVRIPTHHRRQRRDEWTPNVWASRRLQSNLPMPIQETTASVLDLQFDPQNPRLPEDVQRTQPDMFRYIVREIGVDDLIDSFSSSGVINADPMIARPANPGEEKGRFYVIEGNRRLAALKLLNGVKLEDGETERPILAMTPSVVTSVRQVRVQTGWPEDDLEAYLGYKHVTSSREWSPEAKARFVVERCKGDYSLDTLRKFAKRLGTKVPTLRRWLVALLTLKQAERAGKFDPSSAFSKRYFGTFYTLLGSGDVQSFLKLSDDINTDPVPSSNIDNLQEFIGWSIGTSQSPPVINSRQQKELAAVLSSPRALAHFRSKKSLDQALMYTEFNSGEIIEKLRAATYAIEDCLSMLYDVKDQEEVKSAIDDLDKAYLKLKHNSRS